MAEVAKKRLPKWAVIVGVLIALVVIGQLSRAFTGVLERESAEAGSEASESKLPAYEIVTIEDVSAGATPRFEYRVAVEGQPTPAQLEAIAEEIFETAKAGKNFSALAIGFFDFPEYADEQYTLGQVEYAPGGDWAAASTIEPGDYDAMEAKVDLPTKDWSKQLTADEVGVWSAWWTEYRAQADAIGSDPSRVVDEAAVTEKVARDTGKTVDDVKAILVKQQVWASK